MVFIFRGFALRFFFCSGLKVSLFVFAGGPGGGVSCGSTQSSEADGARTGREFGGWKSQTKGA